MVRAIAEARLAEGGGHVLPTAWAMDGFVGLIFEGRSYREVLPNVGVPLAMATAIGTLGVVRFRKRLVG